MNKKRIAKEWLFFFGALGFGLLILPISLILIFSPMSLIEALGNFYSSLFASDEGLAYPLREALQAWFLVLCPYFLLQLIRSILWAIKAIRS
jgi:hypothetical protein